MSTCLARSLGLALLLVTASAQAQGLLVATSSDSRIRLPRPVPHSPTPPQGYRINSLEVQARLIDQVAQVQVTQVFQNTGSTPLEVSFVFPLPYDGAIDRLTLMVDGREVPAELLSAEEARRQYEEIVRKNQDPALLEWIGTGMFRTRVFPVPAGAERKVSLRYSQVCRQQHGLSDFLFPLSTAKYTSGPLEKLAIDVTIECQSALQNVYSPTHQVEIERSGERNAHVRFAAANVVPGEDFRLLYDVGEGAVGASLLSYRPSIDDEGYFLLLAAPRLPAADAAAPAAKTVVFVVDRSGSMSGEKIVQAKEALKFVLRNLREGDLFNIIAYDNHVESFRPELARFDNESRLAANGFVEGLYAGGSTDINAALTTALAQLKDSDRPSYVLFLTDGLPTAGEQNEAQIVANAAAGNQVRARMMVFGVGYDVNSRLLDKLARGGFGQSHYVRPNESIESHVAALFRQIESPVLTDVAIELAYDGQALEDGPPVSRVYPKGQWDLFQGEQLVVVGRYRRPGPARLVLRGQLNGQTQSFEFPVELVEHSADGTSGFVERLWAMRRIGEIIDQIDLTGRNDELIKELVELSTRHGILTPYTSFLADEATNLNDLAANRARASDDLYYLEDTDGRFAFEQRQLKNRLQTADQAAMPALLPTPAGAAVDGAAAGAHHSTRPHVEPVRNVAGKAFFRRGKQWVDSTLSEAQIASSVAIEQFSPAYFKLATDYGRETAQYLTFDDEVLINVSGTCYRIVPRTN